jgi:hypothetical protein
VVIRRGYSICNSADSIYLFHLFEAADYKIMLLEITWLFSIYKKRLANLDISFDYKQDRYVCSVFSAFENRSQCKNAKQKALHRFFRVMTHPKALKNATFWHLSCCWSMPHVQMNQTPSVCVLSLHCLFIVPLQLPTVTVYLVIRRQEYGWVKYIYRGILIWLYYTMLYGAMLYCVLG